MDAAEDDRDIWRRQGVVILWAIGSELVIKPYSWTTM